MMENLDIELPPLPQEYALTPQSPPHDDITQTGSPQTVSNSPAERNDENKPKIPRSALLAKRRLQSFCNLKMQQSLNMSPFKKQQNMAGVFGASADLIDSKAEKESKKTQSRKGQKPLERKKTVIEEIEEIKKQEFKQDLALASIELSDSSTIANIDGLIITIPPVSEENHFKRREVKYRNYRGNYRRSPSPEYPSSQRKPNYPTNWTEFKKNNFSFNHIRELNADRNKSKKYTDYARQLRFETNSVVMESFKVDSVHGDKKHVPFHQVRYTRAEPRIAYSPHQIRSKMRYLKRPEVFDVVRKEVKQHMLKIMNNETVVKFKPARPVSVRHWYPKNWKVQDYNEARLSENSLGLSFLLNYSDDNEEEEEETENVKSVDRLKDLKKDNQPAIAEVTKTVPEVPLNQENDDKSSEEKRKSESKSENDNEERKISKDCSSSDQFISNVVVDLNDVELPRELPKDIEIPKIEKKEDIEDKQHFTPSKHSKTEFTFSEEDYVNISKDSNSCRSKLKIESPPSSKKDRKEKKKKGKKVKKSHKNESRKTEDIEKELLEIEEKLREHKKNSKKQKVDQKKKIEQPTVESDKDIVSVKKSHESKKKKKKREKAKKYKSPDEDSDDSDEGESKKKKHKEEKKKDKRSKSKSKKRKKSSSSVDCFTASNEEIKSAVVEKKKKKVKDQTGASEDSPDDNIEAAEDSQTPELIKTSSKDDICLSDLGDFDIAKEEFKLEKSMERELQTSKVKSKSETLPDKEVEKNEKDKENTSKPEEEKLQKILEPKDKKTDSEDARSPVHKPKSSESKKQKSPRQIESCKTNLKQSLTLNPEKVFDLREKINKRKSRRSINEKRDSDLSCLKKCKEAEFGERKVWKYDNLKIDVNYFDIEKDPGTPPMPNEKSRSDDPESSQGLDNAGKQKTPDTDDYHSFWESEDEPRRKISWDSEEEITERLRKKVKKAEKEVKSPPKLQSPKRPSSPMVIPLCIKPFSRSSRNRWDKSHVQFQEYLGTSTEIKLVEPEQNVVTEKKCEIAVEREKSKQVDAEQLESLQTESEMRDKKLVDSNEWEDESNDHIPRDILHKKTRFDNILTSTPSTQSKNEEYSLDNSLTSISSADLSFDKISQRSTTPNVLENQYEEFLKAVSTDLPEENRKGEIKSLTPVKKQEQSIEQPQTKSPVIVKLKVGTSDSLNKTDISQRRQADEPKAVQKITLNEIVTAQIVPAPVPSPRIDSNVFSIPTLDLTKPAFVQVAPENKNESVQKPFTFTAMTLPSKKLLRHNSALNLDDDSNSDDDMTDKFKNRVEDLQPLPAALNKKSETVVKSVSDSKSPSKQTVEREIPAKTDDVNKYIDQNMLIPCVSAQKEIKSKATPALSVQKVTELVGLSLKRSRSRSPIRSEQKPFADRDRHKFAILSKKEYSPRRRRSMSPRKISPPRHKSPKRRRYSPSRKSPDFRKSENRRSPDHAFKLRNRSPSMSPRRQSPRPGLRTPRRSSSPRKRSLSPRKRSPSPRMISISPRMISISPRRRSLSPRRRSISPRNRSISPRNRSISPRRRSISPRNCSPKRRKMSPLHERKDQSPKRRPISPPRKPLSPLRRPLSPLRRPSSPLRRPLSPLRRPLSPVRRPLSPLRKPLSPPRKPLSPLRKHREVSPRMSQRSYTDLEVRPRSPASSPLQSLKKSVADSTISDDLLLLRNNSDCGESPSFRKNRYEIGRMASNENMSQTVHYKKEPKLETSMDYTNYTDCSYNQSFYDQYGQYNMQYNQYNQSFHTNKTQSLPSKSASHVVQVGNVLEVVPTENLEACTTKRTVRSYTKIQAAESTQKIVQVGNMLQIVPHSDEEKIVPKVASEPPNLSVAEIDKVDVAKIDPNILAKPELRPEDIEKQSAEDLMKQKAAERRAEREKRRQERENRRREKEKKRKEKEKKKQIKLKLKTENIIKKALLVEAGLEFDDDHNAEVDLTPVPIIITDNEDGKEPGRSILISTLDKSEDDFERQIKSVSFADGIRPGEGTSPSGGEELASPPPPTFSSVGVPKKDKKKKIKIPKKIKKKKVRVKVIKRPSIDDSSEDDNLPPPPPPPGSPPSHLFPPRVKTHTVNNVPPAVIPGLLSLLRPPPPPVQQDPPCPPTPTQPVFRPAPSPVVGAAYGQTTGASVIKYMRQLSSSSQSSTSAASTPQISTQSPFPYPQPYHQNKLHTSQLMQTSYSTPNPNLQYIHPVINQTQYQIPQRSPIQSQYHVPQPSPVQNQYMVNTQNPPPVSTAVLQQSMGNQQYQHQQQVLYSHPPLQQQQSHNLHLGQPLSVQMLRKSEEKKSSSPRERRSSRSRRSKSKSPQRRRSGSSAYSRHDSGKLRRSRSSSSSEYRHFSDRDSRDRRRKR